MNPMISIPYLEVVAAGIGESPWSLECRLDATDIWWFRKNPGEKQLEIHEILRKNMNIFTKIGMIQTLDFWCMDFIEPGWWFQTKTVVFIFTRKIGEDEPILTIAYFSKGLVKQPHN